MHHIKTAIISFFIAINLISCSSMPSSKISVINGHCEPVIMPLELKEIKNKKRKNRIRGLSFTITF